MPDLTPDEIARAPVGARFIDRDGDVWERRARGLLLVRVNGAPYHGATESQSSVVESYGPLRPYNVDAVPPTIGGHGPAPTGNGAPLLPPPSPAPAEAWETATTWGPRVPPDALRHVNDCGEPPAPDGPGWAPLSAGLHAMETASGPAVERWTVWQRRRVQP